MATKRLVTLDPIKAMAKGRPSGNGRASLSSAAAHEVLPIPAASHNDTAAFDPSLFLAKLATGKTNREYRSNERVFSQGDAADAVFYVQSGKVKLTVVSKRGKEAVVAILPEASFFGEEPEVAERFVAHLISRNIRMEEDLVDQLFNSSEKRLARLPANFGQDPSQYRSSRKSARKPSPKWSAPRARASASL